MNHVTMYLRNTGPNQLRRNHLDYQITYVPACAREFTRAYDLLNSRGQ